MEINKGQKFGFPKDLFVNNDPEKTWEKALPLSKEIRRDFDGLAAKKIFDDVIRIFRGEYPGYRPIKTPYHDLSHTLNVFICAVRLMHGVHVSGTPLTNRDILLVMIATLMHDIGYAQSTNEDSGTGAQFTRNHVERGIRFMREYISGQDAFPDSFLNQLESMMQSTEQLLPFRKVGFPSSHTMMLGQIVATADYVGQMSDRIYPEKLAHLFEEFKEAGVGNYHDFPDLLSQTGKFYELTLSKLDTDLGKVYDRLKHHFRRVYGENRNFYMEAIEKNIAYVEQANRAEMEKRQGMLRRGNPNHNIRIVKTA